MLSTCPCLPSAPSLVHLAVAQHSLILVPCPWGLIQACVLPGARAASCWDWLWCLHLFYPGSRTGTLSALGEHTGAVVHSWLFSCKPGAEWEEAAPTRTPTDETLLAAHREMDCIWSIISMLLLCQGCDLNQSETVTVSVPLPSINYVSL